MAILKIIFGLLLCLNVALCLKIKKPNINQKHVEYDDTFPNTTKSVHYTCSRHNIKVKCAKSRFDIANVANVTKYTKNNRTYSDIVIIDNRISTNCTILCKPIYIQLRDNYKHNDMKLYKVEMKDDNSLYFYFTGFKYLAGMVINVTINGQRIHWFDHSRILDKKSKKYIDVERYTYIGSNHTFDIKFDISKNTYVLFKYDLLANFKMEMPTIKHVAFMMTGVSYKIEYQSILPSIAKVIVDCENNGTMKRYNTFFINNRTNIHSSQFYYVYPYGVCQMTVRTKLVGSNIWSKYNQIDKVNKTIDKNDYPVTCPGCYIFNDYILTLYYGEFTYLKFEIRKVEFVLYTKNNDTFLSVDVTNDIHNSSITLDLSKEKDIFQNYTTSKSYIIGTFITYLNSGEILNSAGYFINIFPYVNKPEVPNTLSDLSTNEYSNPLGHLRFVVHQQENGFLSVVYLKSGVLFIGEKFGFIDYKHHFYYNSGIVWSNV